MSWVALALQIALMVVVLWRLYRQMQQQLSAEQAVATAASHTTAVFNSVREPIAVLDRELVLTLCNPAFVQLYARSEAGDAGEAGEAAAALVPMPLTALGDGQAWNDPVVLQRLQDVLSREPRTRSFDDNVRAGGLLERDHVLVVKFASWLNDTEKTIHMEATLNLTYQWEKEETTK